MATPVCFHFIYGRLHATVAEQSRDNTDHVACRPEDIYHLVFFLTT